MLSLCNTMGEGWLLTAEMCDLIETGTPNIVCCSPFACLPNHVVGKAVIKRLREMHPESIVAVDDDPGASEVNQLNPHQARRLPSPRRRTTATTAARASSWRETPRAATTSACR